MNTRYYFHICTQEKRFSGSGETCFDAAVAAVGLRRAELLSKNTEPGYWMNGGDVVGSVGEGVANFTSKNGITVASVTRLVSN